QRDRFIPRSAPKFSFAFRSYSDLRKEQAAIVVRPLEIFRDFRAEKSLRERMFALARDAHRTAILDGDEHRASVGTIVRANRADHFNHWEASLPRGAPASSRPVAAAFCGRS